MSSIDDIFFGGIPKKPCLIYLSWGALQSYFLVIDIEHLNFKVTLWSCQDFNNYTIRQEKNWLWTVKLKLFFSWGSTKGLCTKLNIFVWHRSFLKYFGLDKESTCKAGDRGDSVWSLGQKDPLEEEMATHSSILAWTIPWTEEPGRLQSRGLQKVRQSG